MTSLGIWIVLEFMHLAWSLYCIIHYSLIIQSCYSHCSTILPLLCIFVCILWETVFSVPIPLWQINMVSNLMARRSSDLSKKGFWQILYEKLSKSSKFHHCTRSQGLPLNTPHKGIVDQACLINYVGCDENSKSTDYQPYFVYFILWFIGLSVCFTAFTTSSSVSFTTFATIDKSLPLHSRWSL